jgi:group II intron reverse transcriptase/maturase
LERVYRHLFDPELFLKAYGNIYRNFGAMTRGATKETVDRMSLQKINTIIGLLRMERYRWTPVRRSYIEKQDGSGKKRPLGIPTWSDKLVQDVIRSLLEPYYERKFSDHSHGFRPKRSCHTALAEIRKKWKGTVWFIEGDIKGCFDNIDHEILLSILRRDIHDGRLIKLIGDLLDAGYMENWRYYDSLSGTPQGGIISPLLANIYLDELDRYIEDTLIPAYTSGEIRRTNPEHMSLTKRIKTARRRMDTKEVKRLICERRKVPSMAPCDPDYRRLRYVRYADDFLLGFVGPKQEADNIRRQIGEFLELKLKLTLSMEKTLITHAGDEKAKFLGHEIKVIRERNLVANDGRRAANGAIALLMPRKVVSKYRALYSRKGKIIHRAELLPETDYTIIQRYQSVLRGLYNFYCMAHNVSRRMGYINNILRTSLLKTLAHKFGCRVTRIVKKYRVITPLGRMLQVTIKRPEKEPLVATYGGIPFRRMPQGQGRTNYSVDLLWSSPASNRSELVQRLLAEKCELCGKEGPLEAHHIRKLADIDRPGRRPTENWQKVMAARKRKSLVVCVECHDEIHAGRYDGPKL